MNSTAHRERMAARRIKQLGRVTGCVHLYKGRLIPNTLHMMDNPKPTSVAAGINRHTGKPHEHKREITRYLRKHPAAVVVPVEPVKTPRRPRAKKAVAA